MLQKMRNIFLELAMQKQCTDDIEAQSNASYYQDQFGVLDS